MSTLWTPGQYTPDEARALAAAWAEQVRSGQFSNAVRKVGTIRKMGHAGDAPLDFPVVALLDRAEDPARRAVQIVEARERMTAAERWAMDHAAGQIARQQGEAQRKIGMKLFVTATAGGDLVQGEEVDSFDPTVQAGILITAPIAGG